ncbi:helix-turn-helix transcriptional regulator [Ancylomarina sp. 16SWW S1-10-2]|uniref:helix-turn-helix transcriptional regulator n=1 Tax=Ancylomarina sp. 16SWW S1-10-2 TaxID=2499681 RepID=UPI0012ADE6C8|nr:helix-turn-helix transcriptional regulator [Ancylomarina sp. 16SWW S1-10-2]MRT92382.1 XRE family transcriptional regulator [Ancylomarina sp. 16SWW S1-10-2]
MANINKLNKLASSESKWIEEAKERQKNKSWLKHSQKIAVIVLKTLKEKKIKQTQLAEIVGVSPQQINKIVKGKENLTLQTISGLEDALDIKLIFATKDSKVISKSFKLKKESTLVGFYNNKVEMPKMKLLLESNVDVFQSERNQNCLQYA